MSAPGLEQRVEQMEAAHAVQNLMGRLAYLHVASKHAEIPALFALGTPGVRAETPGGVYEGREGIERVYLWFAARGGEGLEGTMHMHTLTTPLIEVAADLRTAKAIWTCPGHATGPHPSGTLEATWVWTKYGCDFVQEDGEWKIWHLHVFGIFHAAYTTSWVDEQWDGRPRVIPPGGPVPDRPSTGWWQYRTDLVYPNLPAPPAPYQVFDPGAAF